MSKDITQLKVENEKLRKRIRKLEESENRLKKIEKNLSWESSVNAILGKMASHLIQFASIDEITKHVVELMKIFTDSSFCYVSCIDEETGDLISSLVSVEDENRHKKKPKQIGVDELGNFVESTVKNFKSYIINSQDGIKLDDEANPFNITFKRLLTVPAKIGSTLFGYIILANSIRDYTENDLVFVERMACIYALGVERKRNEEELKQYHLEHLDSLVLSRTKELARTLEKQKKSEKEKETLEHQFTRLASTIHNLLKNRLDSANYQLISALEQIPEELETVIKPLNIAHKLVAFSSKVSKNILFSLENKECSFNNLSKELEFRTKLALSNSKISHHLKIDKLPHENIIKQEVVYCILEIFSELLSNVIKHSQASDIHIEFRYNQENIFLSFEENGMGFNFEYEIKQAGSYGLRIIKRLAEENNGILKFERKDHKMFTTFTINLN